MHTRGARRDGGPRRVFGYSRVSGAEQGRHGNSLENQQSEIRAYCERLGLPKPDIRAEVASGSAKELARRVELGGLLADVQAGDLVLVSRVDRWSRDIVHGVDSVRRLVAAGVGWRSIGEGIDAADSHGDSMLGLMAWAADNERKRIVERTVGTRKLLRDEGLYVEGRAPLGYRRERRGVLVVVPDEARIVRAIFKRCIGGMSVAQIMRSVAADFHYKRDRKGIHVILRNRLYLGEAKDATGEWMAAAHEPIIDPVTFRRADQAMASRHMQGRRPSPRAKNADWLLRGFATCGDCGSRMSTVYRSSYAGRAVDYYACAGRIAKRGCRAANVHAREANEQAAESVGLRLRDLARLIAIESEREQPPPPPDIAGARHDLEAKRDRLLDLYSDGAFGKAALRKRMRAVEDAIVDLDEREAAEQRRRALADGSVRRKLLGHVENLHTAWQKATPADRREILHAVARTVVLRAGELPKPSWFSLDEFVREL